MAFQGEWAEELEVDRARGSFMTGLETQSHTTFGLTGGLLGKVQQYFFLSFLALLPRGESWFCHNLGKLCKRDFGKSPLRVGKQSKMKDGFSIEFCIRLCSNPL